MALNIGFVLFAIVLVSCAISLGNSIECEWLTEPKGVISTPNFPRSYPVPLRSCYVIKRERRTKEKQTKTILYFTQFFLNEIFVESYKKFVGIDSPLNSVRVSRKAISAPTRPTSLIIPQLYTVIQVEVNKPIGANLRVPENLMDVYGFNITYEIIDVAAKTRLEDDPKISEPCMKHQCSYNGMCRADTNLTSYYCDCFRGFWGNACQFSNRCNEKNTDRCKHATRCEHFMGLTTLLCFCEAGYTGQECDRRYEPDRCKEQGCPAEKFHACAAANDRNARCECGAGNRLVGCDCETGWTLSESGQCMRDPTEHLLWEFEYPQDLNLDSLTEELRQIKHIESAIPANLSLSGTAVYELAVAKDHTTEVKNTLKKRYGIKNIQNEDFVILNVVSNKPMPVHEGNTPLVLSCDYRAGRNAEVNWYKDGALINPLYGPGNVWIERSKRSQSGISSSYLGLDHVQYIDRGIFTCEVSWKGQKRRRSLTMDIKMRPSGTLSPSAQNVEYGKPAELWCGIRIYLEELQYRWYKNTLRDETNGKKQWVPIVYKNIREEYVEPLHPSRSRLVIPAVRSYAEYKCAIETATFSTEMFSHVFPFSNTSLFCPAEEHLGVFWNRTVVGSFDVQVCMFSVSPKGETKRMCVLGADGEPHWAVPDFFDCAFQEIYEIRKEILGLARGYQMTTAIDALARLADYLTMRKDLVLPGEGNHIIETLHEVMEYDDKLPKNHPEIKNRKTAVLLFLDCVSATFNVSNAVSDDRFYAKLNDMIPQVVIRYLSHQPRQTDFHYVNDLFEIKAEVFKPVVPAKNHMPLYTISLAHQGVTGRVHRSGENSAAGDKLILSLLVFKSIEKEYLSRLEWIEHRGTAKLFSKLASFKVATLFETNQSLLYRSDEKTVVNFRLKLPANTSVLCARIVEGSDVNFEGSEVTEINDELSCESRGSSLFALYAEPSPIFEEVQITESSVFRNVCALIGIFISFICALSISCMNSSWSLIKCVKLNVCIALLALFTTALVEASAPIEEVHLSKLKLLRQFFILVCQAQQLLVMVMLFVDPERGLVRKGLNIYFCLAATWIVPGILLALSFGVQQIANTDEHSYWGTLEDVVTVPDANFTAMIIIGSTIYGLILAEVGIASTDPPECRMTTAQKGILKRSLIVTAAIFFHGITTTGYVQDVSGNLQGITSVLMALIVFLVYTAYCETEVFYSVLWAHYKKKKEAKSLSHT